MSEPLTVDVTREGEEVVIYASLKPEVQCFCLEHEWRIRVEGPEGLLQEWGWRAKAGEEGYRGLSVRWKPPLPGRYGVWAELATHRLRAETSFSYSPASGWLRSS